MEVSILLLVTAFTTLGAVADEADLQHSYVDRLAQLEEEIDNEDKSPFRQMAMFKQPSTEALRISKFGLDILNASNREFDGEDMSKKVFPIAPTCSASCNAASQYRTADGSCNNLIVPCLGKSNTVYCRLLPADYSDGVQAIRRATDGSSLPTPRDISLGVFDGDASRISNLASLSVMQWGQFLDHDTVSTPIFSGSIYTNTAIQCCNSTLGLISPSPHAACLPIPVSTADSIFNQPSIVSQRGFFQTCMNFVRSISASKITNPQDNYLNQLDQITHWVDGSNVYGSDSTAQSSLRAFTNGLLLTSGNSLMPPLPNGPAGTFLCGDSRCNEQPGLTVMHTLWVREHNRVANGLRSANPRWNDEQLFQEARRIVAAEMQHITYNEFLPVVLGPDVMNQYSLNPAVRGFFNGYANNQTCGPALNEFAAAAFRMGHSLVQGNVLLYGENGNVIGSYNLFQHFIVPAVVDISITDLQSPPPFATTFLDGTIRSFLRQPVQAVDGSVVDDLRNQLFNNGVVRFGPFDLVSLNIQRGRDHGLPSYNWYRRHCSLPTFNSFLELPTTCEIKIKLASVYKSVNDIDLFVGAILEPPVQGGLVGPTFACIIGRQFSLLKKTDRFYYELGNQPGSFTSAQLDLIRKTSLARVFCDNNDGTVKQSQARAFLQPDGVTNPVKLCKDIPRGDIWVTKNNWIRPYYEIDPVDPSWKRPFDGSNVDPVDI